MVEVGTVASAMVTRACAGRLGCNSSRHTLNGQIGSGRGGNAQICLHALVLILNGVSRVTRRARQITRITTGGLC